MKFGLQGDARSKWMKIWTCLFILFCLLGQAQVLLAGPQEKSIHTAQQGLPFGYTVVLHAGSVQSSWLQAKATVEADFDFSSPEPPLSNLSLVLEDVNIRLDQDWIPLRPITLQAQVERDASGRLFLQNISCRIGDSQAGGGNITQKDTGWGAHFVLRPQSLVDEFSSLWPWLSSIAWSQSGEQRLEIDLFWRPENSHQPPVLEGSIQTKSHIQWLQAEKSADLILPPAAMSFKINLQDGKISWELGAQDRVQWGQIMAAAPEAEGEIQLHSSGLRILQAKIQTRLATRQEPEVVGPAVDIQAQETDIRPPGAKVGKMTIHMQELGAVDIQGQWGQGSTSNIQIRAQGLQLSGIQTWLRAAGQAAKGWDVQGGLDVMAEIGKKPDGILGSWEMAFQDVGGASGDGHIMAAGLKGNGRGSIKWDSRPQASFFLQTGQGEVVWGTRYANLEQASVSVQGNGEIDPGRKIRFTDLQGRIGDFIHLQAGGSLNVTSDQPRWEIQMDESRVQLEPLSAAVQDLLPSGWQVQGSIGWTGSISSAESGPQIRGRFVGNQLSLEVPEAGVELKDWSFDLPVEYCMGQIISAADLPRAGTPWGALRPGELNVAQREVDLSGTDIRLARNRFEIRPSIEVQGKGIQAELGRMQVHLPWTGDWGAQGELILSDLRPSQLIPFGPDNMGRLQGRLQWTASAQKVGTQGRIHGNLFEGEVSIENIGVKRPLEPSRLMQADVSIHGLNLEPLSQSLGIGKITGKLNVDVQKLGIAYGQPVRFHLRAASVPEPKESRRISLQAVNSLSIIGTGRGLSGLGIGLYAQFFEQFPYDRMGLSCVLANDVFSLNGLIHEQGVEYIVKRGWTGINVINTNPNNMIAFSDMLDRLERVTAQGG